MRLKKPLTSASLKPQMTRRPVDKSSFSLVPCQAGARRATHSVGIFFRPSAYSGFDTRNIILEIGQARWKFRSSASALVVSKPTFLRQSINCFCCSTILWASATCCFAISSRVSAMPILYQIENPNPN